MLLAKVVGTVVATKKDETLVGCKLLIVKPLKKCLENTKESEMIVAVDSVGAGIGETVLVVTGSTANRTVAKNQAPVDAAIVGIVDDIELYGES